MADDVYIPMEEGDTLKVQFDPKTRDIISVKVLTPSKATRLRKLLRQIQVMGNANAYSLAEEALYVLAQMHPVKYAINDRPITLGEFYDGHPPDDPPGRYYTYDDDPGVTHWMSVGAMSIRCKEID